MTDYSKLTDSDINRLVMAALGYVRDDDLESEWYFDPKGESHNSDKGGPLVKLRSFCGDWGRIGPIIHDNQIEISITQCAAGSGPAWWCTSDRHLNDFYSGYQPTPMRAAAICFLLMKDKT